MERGSNGSLSTLAEAIEALSGAEEIDHVVAVVRAAARRISGADGASFILRDKDQCWYVDEDAIGPLWKGRRFPMSACISGWSMLHKETVIVPDIYADERIPHDAYRPTFVKSLLMVPVGLAEPVAAIGVYWASSHAPDQVQVKQIETLARATATALTIVQLRSSLRESGETVAKLSSIAQSEAQARREAEMQLAQLSETLDERVARAVEERRELAEALHHAQRLEAIGRLTGGIAHDFNNLLTAAMGSLDLVVQMPTTTEKAQSLIAVAQRALARGARLTAQLLAFGRRQTLSPRATNIAALLHEIDVLLRRALGEGIALELPPLEPQHVAFIDPSHFQAVILNLAQNARDAMPNGGRLAIEIGSAMLDGAFPAVERLAPGEYVCVKVRDTGKGMSPAVRAQAFEPFFTTKERGKGTGLGLSQVLGFVRQSGGHVELESAEGAGTTVTMYLPRAADATRALNLSATFPRVLQRAHTILLVEDDHDVRESLMAVLKSLGLRVLTAATGEEALGILNGTDPIDAVLTDIIMPGRVNGIDVAQAAKRLRSGIKILLTSGYAGEILRSHGLDGAFPLISKPFRQNELVARLNELLTGDGADPGSA